MGFTTILLPSFSRLQNVSLIELMLMVLAIARAHVSVRMYLMRGEFDDHLKWPFRADVTIELLDQQGNER